MEKFFNSTFDALTNVIPGGLFLLSLLILSYDLNSLDDLILTANKIDIGGSVFMIFISYVIGFALTPIGKKIYHKLGFLIWPFNQKKNNVLSISDKYILVREFSPNNFKYIETWNMFCNLAHNLAVSSLAILITSTLRIVLFENSNKMLFISLIIFSIISFFIFLNRAVVFKTWAMNDLDAAINTLKLGNKVNKVK